MSNPKNQQSNSNHRVFQCTRCTSSFSQQKVYHEHLRSHMPMPRNNVQSQTADETARYIAERRKNYPTADNISKKMKSEEERQERGDILETRQFGRMKERKTIPNRNLDAEPTAPAITTTLTNNPNATLLERLLASDIRRERNMVLQSIRHIVNNNFYGLDTQ